MKVWLKIIIGFALGALVGLVTQEQYPILVFLGKVFIDLLKMLVGMIVFSSIITGVCHIHDPKKLGRIGLRTLVFYCTTTLIAIGLGLVLVTLLQPGAGLNLFYDESLSALANRVSILEFIGSIVPSNPFAAFVEGNILQVIIFAIFFAYAIILSGEKGKPVLSFFESVSEIMTQLTHFVMKFAPYGVFGLIATSVGSIGARVLPNLFNFLMCNYLACLIQLFVVFGFIVKFMTHSKVLPFFKGMKDAIVLAFTTSSSAATLPITMECARDHLGISEDVSGFVLSLGSTINMNGGAIGQVISTLFIAQAYGVELSWLSLCVVIVTSLLSAVGAAGIPGSGIVMLSVVLNSVGLPLEGIALVAGVDRLREMVSSVVNVLGDAVGALYIARKEGQMNEETYNHAAWLQ